MENEHMAVKRVFESQGNVPVDVFTMKRLNRRQLPLSSTSLVVGDHAAMKQVFKQLNVKLPPADCYPQCIRSFLKRRIWTSTVRYVLGAADNLSQPIFVKPKDDTKEFTGMVLKTHDGFCHLRAIISSRRRMMNVYCSAVVDFVAEWRVFVVNGKVVGVRQYTGKDNEIMDDNNLVPQLDMGVVQACINEFEGSYDEGHSPAGYGLDFGVLRHSTETVLVEWNDGYGLGSYGLDAATYTNLLTARWTQLTRNE